nr:hypothetical protein [Tanacetum cinerariifolium]
MIKDFDNIAFGKVMTMAVLEDFLHKKPSIENSFAVSRIVIAEPRVRATTRQFSGVEVDCFLDRMELFYFIDEVFDSEYVQVQVMVQQVQSWKHVYASSGEIVWVQTRRVWSLFIEIITADHYKKTQGDQVSSIFFVVAIRVLEETNGNTDMVEKISQYVDKDINTALWVLILLGGKSSDQVSPISFAVAIRVLEKANGNTNIVEKISQVTEELQNVLATMRGVKDVMVFAHKKIKE